MTAENFVKGVQEGRPARGNMVKENFIEYLNAHPEDRFWQALQKWSGHRFILVSEHLPDRTGMDAFGMDDTYYWEGRDR